MCEVKVLEFQKEYPTVNLELTKDKVGYDSAIIYVHIAELENGFIVKKIFKTNKTGTKVTYKPCETVEELEEYIKKVNNLIKDLKGSI